MTKQITNSIVMVRPADFRMNEETAVNNFFQKNTREDASTITEKAQQEFDDFVHKLREVGIQVSVVNDHKENNTPDSVFPNNWVTFHENGDIALYPMFAENRRKERREDILEHLEKDGFDIKNVVDYTSAEADDLFLEGTGSLILDRQNEKAYCALSERADEGLLIEFCEDFGYMPIIFHAYQSVQEKREIIYHTNVMMCLAEEFAIVCLDSIDDKKERKMVVESLEEDRKEIINISEGQLHEFAGNMLQLQGDDDKKYLVMSRRAHESLTPNQISQIEQNCDILSSNLQTIETLGGGSARCMIAENFLPQKA